MCVCGGGGGGGGGSKRGVHGVNGGIAPPGPPHSDATELMKES